jgi:hypothetical protein
MLNGEWEARATSGLFFSLQFFTEYSAVTGSAFLLLVSEYGNVDYIL